MLNRIFISFLMSLPLLSSCTTLSDCECSMKGSQSNGSWVHYDYEGSCSELEDDESVTCSAKWD